MWLNFLIIRSGKSGEINKVKFVFDFIETQGIIANELQLIIRTLTFRYKNIL